MQKDSLKRRVEYFLNTRRRGRNIAADFIDQLTELGAIVIIGGMLRDLTLHGNRNFYSDIDLVIEPKSLSVFERKMREVGAKQNKYGGYGTTVGKWKVDVWPLEKTWAKVEGYKSVDQFPDLLNVTFFNWDAILYDLNNKKIITYDNYFDDLQKQILDINLEPSLNPAGNAIRTLRSIYKHKARLTRELAAFTERVLCEYENDFLIEKEKTSYSQSFLCNDHLNCFRQKLSEYLCNESEELFTFQFKRQMRLPISL